MMSLKASNLGFLALLLRGEKGLCPTRAHFVIDSIVGVKEVASTQSRIRFYLQNEAPFSPRSIEGKGPGIPGYASPWAIELFTMTYHGHGISS